jgi:hypothetical protein
MSVKLPTGDVGEPGECRSCHASVVWVVRPKDGRRAPYDIDGRHHNATCPDASRLWNGAPRNGTVAHSPGER